MTHTVTAQGKLQILALTGEVDMHSSPAVRKVVLDLVKTGSPVAVDLAAVTYMDSSGVATLVEALQNAKKNGARLRARCTNRQCVGCDQAGAIG